MEIVLERHLGPAGLLHWLQAQRSATYGTAADAAQIRLESDERAVRITTVHRSKGLEYPIVFCPFSWDGSLLRGQDKEHPRFHDPEREHRLTLDLGMPS